MKLDTADNAVLGSFLQRNRACGCFNVDIGSNRIGVLNTSDDILQIRVAISNHLCAFADCRHSVSLCRDTDRARNSDGRADRQFISRL